MINSEITDKLDKLSFNSLDRLGINWRDLVNNNDKLKDKYYNYLNLKKDWIICSTDFSQLEIFVLASLSGDKTLIEAVNSGLDVHNFNTAKVYGINWQEIKTNLAIAKDDNDLEKINQYQLLWEDFQKKRKFIKALSFSLSYGAGAGKIAHELRITIEEATKLINDFYSTYPKLKEWQGQTLLKAIKTGYLETPLHRKRATPALIGRHDAFKAFIEEDKKTIKQLKNTGEYWNLRNEFKTVLNTNVQSTATDMCSMAAIKTNKAFKKKNLRAHVYFWVHDSIVFDCHIDDAIEAILLVSDIMENQVKYDGDPVNYRVETEVGYTYEYAEKLDRNDITTSRLTKKLLLEKLGASLDADTKKKFKLIVKATSTVMDKLPEYIAAMREAKGDYFNEQVERLGLGVSTPSEYMALLNDVSIEEYESSMGFAELDDENEDDD